MRRLGFYLKLHVPDLDRIGNRSGLASLTPTNSNVRDVIIGTTRVGDVIEENDLGWLTSR